MKNIKSHGGGLSHPHWLGVTIEEDTSEKEESEAKLKALKQRQLRRKRLENMGGDKMFENIEIGTKIKIITTEEMQFNPVGVLQGNLGSTLTILLDKYDNSYEVRYVKTDFGGLVMNIPYHSILSIFTI